MIVDDKIMNYILYQMRTEAEVRRKCEFLKYDESTIDQIIDYVKEAGYINDAKYAKKYVENAIKLKHQSASELKISLLKKGIDEYLADEVTSTSEVYDFEYDSCIYNAKKKYDATGNILKVKKFLLSKGYRYEIINDIIDDITRE
jgi:regulatory protein